jgi:hypothetical protein
MSQLSDDQIEAAYQALEALRGTMPADVIEAMQLRLLADPDEVRQETREEIEEAEAYEIDTIDMPPEFLVASDLSVTLGLRDKKRDVVIRYLNGDDADYLSELVPDAWQYVSKKGRLSLEETPLAEVVDRLVSAALGDVRNGKPTKFKYRFYEALARCLSNPQTGQIITVGFLRGCPTPQLILAARRLWEINHDFFTGPSGELPGNTPKEIASLTGRITKTGKLISGTMTTLIRALSGIGTTRSSGSMNSSIRSLLSTGLASPKSGA